MSLTMPDSAVVDQADAGGPPVTRETTIARPVTRARQLAGLRLFRCRLTIGQPRLPDGSRPHEPGRPDAHQPSTFIAAGSILGFA